MTILHPPVFFGLRPQMIENRHDFYMEFPIPTKTTDRRMTTIPAVIVNLVFFTTPFHSLRYTPQRLAVKIMVDICKIQELAPFPNLLSPIP